MWSLAPKDASSEVLHVWVLFQKKWCFPALFPSYWTGPFENYNHWKFEGLCSAATEGKRLAEQLVASFAASTDPVADAGECLASAALWLQTMKSRMQTGDSVGLATSSISGLGSSSSSRGSLGSLRTPLNGVNMLSQPHVGVATNVGMTSGSGGLGSLAINSGPGISRSNLLGSSVGGHGNTPGAMGSLFGSHGKMGCPGVCFEDFKDRPSDFLRVCVPRFLCMPLRGLEDQSHLHFASMKKSNCCTRLLNAWFCVQNCQEFGDPAAVTATAMGGGQRPEPGVNGNWECEDCKNVNFPRRWAVFIDPPNLFPNVERTKEATCLGFWL